MNDQRFESEFRAWSHRQASAMPSDSLRARVMDIPVRQRGFLPRLTGSFQSMFGATKVVLAGVIVALFGGLLLTGVLTQPSDERAFVGASATAELSARPSQAPATRVTRAETALVPSVELELEELEPGVHHVLGDGVWDLTTNVWDVGVSRDGSVFVEKHRIEYPRSTRRWVDGRVLRLGHPRSEALARDDRGFWLEPYPGGDLAARPTGWQDHWPRGTEYAWDGVGWAELDRPCAVPQGTPCLAAIPGARPSPIDGRLAYVDSAAFGFEGLRPGSALERVGIDFTLDIAADLSIRAATGSIRRGDLQVSVHDGEAWRSIPTDPRITDARSSPRDARLRMALAADGSLWVSEWYRDEGELHAARWDGQGWTTYGPIETRVDAQLHVPSGPVVDADGSVWLDGLVRFDGVTFTAYRAPRTKENDVPRVTNVAHGQDGSLWLTLIDRGPSRLATCPERQRERNRCAVRADGLFVISPDVTGAE